MPESRLREEKQNIEIVQFPTMLRTANSSNLLPNQLIEIKNIRFTVIDRVLLIHLREDS